MSPLRSPDRETIMAATEAVIFASVIIMFVGIFGGLSLALARFGGQGGSLVRAWPLFTLVGCVGAIVVMGLTFAGERVWGERFGPAPGEPEDAVEGVEG